jgi:hypothetical protein
MMFSGKEKNLNNLFKRVIILINIKENSEVYLILITLYWVITVVFTLERINVGKIWPEMI